MKTTIHKQFQVNQPIGRVWEYLSDPSKIVSCVPGASLTEKLDDKSYKGQVTLKFGPVKASYTGQVTFEELDEANRKMTLAGKGMDTKGKGSAEMLMKNGLVEKDGGTEVDCSMEITVTGKIAQFGSRLITDVSDQLFDQFTANFSNKLAEEAPVVSADATAKEVSEATAKTSQADDNAVNAFSILWALIKGFFARLFGSTKTS